MLISQTVNRITLSLKTLDITRRLLYIITQVHELLVIIFRRFETESRDS